MAALLAEGEAAEPRGIDVAEECQTLLSGDFPRGIEAPAELTQIASILERDSSERECNEKVERMAAPPCMRFHRFHFMHCRVRRSPASTPTRRCTYGTIVFGS